MTKTTGLGHGLYVHGYDISGDINALNSIHGGMTGTLDVTDITQLAHERQGGERDGGISFTSLFNPASNRAHPVLSALPSTDEIVTYICGATAGNACASVVSKQLDYGGKRDKAGNYLFDVDAAANGYGLEWGVQVAAKQTVTGAADLASYDYGAAAAASLGLQAYLHVFAFSGTDATVKLADSANNSAFTDVTGGGFTAVTTAPGAQRIAVAGQSIRRYVRVSITTVGGFTSLSFAVHVSRNETAVTF